MQFIFRTKDLNVTLSISAASIISFSKSCVHPENEVYTIVDTKQVGNSTWGKLKSGAGWINIGSAYCKRI